MYLHVDVIFIDSFIHDFIFLICYVIATPTRSDSTSHFFHQKTPELLRQAPPTGSNANTSGSLARVVSNEQ